MKGDVDAYIAAAPIAAQPQLRQLRTTIRRAAPKAVEKVSYGIPFYEYHGRLIYFAAFKKHVGIYPAGDDAEELKEYLSRLRRANRARCSRRRARRRS